MDCGQCDCTLFENERIDDLNRNGYRLIQNKNGFCFGADAVILSGFAQVRLNEAVLDLGCGNGILPILLCAKTEGRHFTGLEIQSASVSLARRSVSLNGLSHKITIDEGDIKNATSIYKAASFDVVVSNPPYINAGGGVTNVATEKMIARHEIMCSLEDVVAAATKLLRPGGRFYLIHKPHRLTDIICLARSYGIEPKTLRFVHPRAGRPPRMVLLECVRGGNSMITVLPPLVIYGEDGGYTDEVYRIYYE